MQDTGTSKVCSVEGCSKSARARGWCPAHYQRWRKHGSTNLVEPIRTLAFSAKKTTCYLLGCDRPVHSLGWCSMHYQRIRRAGYVGPVRSIYELNPESVTCLIVDCNRVLYAHGFCNMHYQRLRATGDPGLANPVRERNGPVCLVKGCNREPYAKSLCEMHRKRQRKYGDLGPVEPIPNGQIKGSNHYWWTGDSASYEAVHQRIRKLQGLAVNYGCLHCTRQAIDWAYTYNCPNEKQSHSGPYSCDLSRYIPLCRSCHKALDKNR